MPLIFLTRWTPCVHSMLTEGEQLPLARLIASIDAARPEVSR